MDKVDKFKRIDIESDFQSFKKKQEKLEQAFPRMNPFAYNYSNEKGEQRINLTKWHRNIAVIDNFQAANDRLSEFFISVEYFKEKITFERYEIDFDVDYKKRFFLAIAADSLRSFLDILTKSIAWFFDFNNKNEIGFSFNNFLKPLKNFSLQIFNSGNQIYQSPAFKEIKSFRDAEKHNGLETRTHLLNKKNFEIEISKPKIINLIELEKNCVELYYMNLKFSEACVSEFLEYDKGYDSPDDKYFKINSDGYLVKG